MKKTLLFFAISIYSTLIVKSQSFSGTTVITPTTAGAIVGLGGISGLGGVLDIYKANSIPASSGPGTGHLILDSYLGVANTFGVDTTSTHINSWIQSRGLESSNFYVLSLNPLGGNVGVGLTTPASLFHSAGQIRTGIPSGGLGGASATTGSLLFYNSSNTNTINIKSGATTPASYDWTLPLAQGAASTVLTNDGSGILSWSNPNTGIASMAWLLTGNSGTIAPTSVITSTVNNNFIGTKDAVDFAMATNNYERLRITYGGNVGIGIKVPLKKLHVSGGDILMDNAWYLRWLLSNGTTTKAILNVDTQDTTELHSAKNGITFKDDGDHYLALMTNTGKWGLGTPTPVNKLDVQGGVAIGLAYAGTYTATANGAIIEGTVGIGTNTPLTKLQVVGGAITIDNNSAYSSLLSGGSNKGILKVSTGNYTELHSAANGITFMNNSNAENARMDNTGKWGLGTPTPVNKLDVEGGVAIGVAYAGTYTATANGAIIEGSVGIGTQSPTAKLEVLDTRTTNGNVGFYVNKTGTLTGTSYGSLISTTGANTTNIGGYFTASGATNNYAGIFVSGNVGIGLTNPSCKLDVSGGGGGTVVIKSSGDIQAVSTVYTSDQMFKTNVDSLHDALATIHQLKPKSYYFDTLKFNGEGKFNFQSVKQYGFIANEVQNILPELVGFSVQPAIVDSLGNVINPAYTYRTLNYTAFISILTKGIQELQQKNDSLQAKANNQDSVNTSLQSQVNQLTVKANNQDSINTSLQNQLATNNTLFQNQLNQLTAVTNNQAVINSTLQNQINQLMETVNSCCSVSTQSENNLQAKSLSEDTIAQIDVKLNDVQSVVLEQNVPNPFAEQTTVNYSLPENTVKAQMLFYNSQGNLIQSVELNPKGKGQLNVFASDLSNGIYTYTLVVDGRVVDSKKMIKNK